MPVGGKWRRFENARESRKNGKTMTEENGRKTDCSLTTRKEPSPTRRPLQRTRRPDHRRLNFPTVFSHDPTRRRTTTLAGRNSSIIPDAKVQNTVSTPLWQLNLLRQNVHRMSLLPTPPQQVVFLQLSLSRQCPPSQVPGCRKATRI